MTWIEEFYSYGVLGKITKEQEELLEKNSPLELFQYRSGTEFDLENIKMVIYEVLLSSIQIK